jgi:hypothetical protein
MHQGMSESKLQEIAVREHTEAVEEYCATLASIAQALDLELEPSPRQLERAREAKLRLDNARTFLQLSTGVDAEVADTSTARPLRPSRVH